MSLETWSEEYYPVQAGVATDSDAKALEHSLRKWRGLLPEALKEHGVELADVFGVINVVDSGRRRMSAIPINDRTCALCCRHPEDCSKCPLCEWRGVPCDMELEDGKNSPFNALRDHYDPKPMIALLEAAEKLV